MFFFLSFLTFFLNTRTDEVRSIGPTGSAGYKLFSKNASNEIICVCFKSKQGVEIQLVYLKIRFGLWNGRAVVLKLRRLDRLGPF